MIISHKIRLAPNHKQATYLAKACGVARFAYNWALAEWQTQYAVWKDGNSQPKPNQMSLRRQLNALKREHFPWMLDVTKNAPQMASIQLGAAFKNFFAGRASYPQFKKKGKSRDSFTLTNDQFSLNTRHIRIPYLGLVRMRETLRFSGPVCGTVHDRDINAAKNLEKYAVSYTVSACGGEGAGSRCKAKVKPAPVKQECNRKLDLG